MSEAYVQDQYGSVKTNESMSQKKNAILERILKTVILEVQVISELQNVVHFSSGKYRVTRGSHGELNE